MTHPLVSAFHRAKQLGWKVKVAPTDFTELTELEVFVDDVMASIPQVKFSVGILCGANHKPYLIWLWPLSEIAEYYYWVDGYTYYRVDLLHKDPVKVVLPHFIQF